MHIQREQRGEQINALAVRPELKQLLSGQVELGPFSEYFAEPNSFYAQGAPQNPADWPTFAARTLLPLWEYEGRIYAADVGGSSDQVISWEAESANDYETIASLDAAVFEMIELHVWEFGGGTEEAEEALAFAEQIALPNLEQLKVLLNDVEACTEAMIDDYRSKLSREA